MPNSNTDYRYHVVRTLHVDTGIRK